MKRVAEMSGGKFQIQLFAAGEIVSGTAVHDAVKDGTVETGFTNSAFYFGKEPTYCIDSAIPFGMNTRQLKAWYRQGNGGKLMGESPAKANIVSIPAGNTGAQMGSWYRKEIKSIADLKGMVVVGRRRGGRRPVQARGRAAIDRRRRHLPGAGKRCDRCG